MSDLELSTLEKLALDNPNHSEFEKKYWTVSQVLGAYFGDIDSLEEGYDSFFDNSEESLSRSLIRLKEFLATDEFSDLEKNKIVQQYVNYRFEDNKIIPLDWLKDFIQKIEVHLKKK